MRSTILSRSEIARVLTGAVLVYAAFLPVAALLQQPPASTPKGKIVIALANIRPMGGLAYRAAAWPLLYFQEGRVYEDDKPLPDYSPQFRDGEVIFSSSDRSDPTKNGRTYFFVVPRTVR
jgi:hypothetical protein